MNEKHPRKADIFWKRISTVSVQQFVAELQPAHASAFGAVVLCAMAVLPVFSSILFPGPSGVQGLEQDEQYWFVQRVITLNFGAFWFHSLLLLGFFAGLLALYALAKRHYTSGLGACLKPDWIKGNLLPFCLGLLLFWSVLSALLSGNLQVCLYGDYYRREGLLAYFLYGVVFFAAMQLSQRHMNWVAEALCGTCAVTAIVAITGGRLIPGLFYLESDLRAVMFHQYNHYGYYLAICFPLCVGLILSDEKPGIAVSLLRLAQFWLICNAIAFNSVRGSFVAIVAALVGWNIAILAGHPQKWKKMLLLDLLFAVTILALNTGSTLLSRLQILFQEVEQVQQVIPSQQETVITDAIDILGTERGLLWRLGIQFALDKPIFGHGPDNLRALYESYREVIPDRPHNELIQIAAMLGLPALALYITGIGSHVVNFFRCFRKLSIFHLALFASVGSYLVSSLFGNTMYYTTPYYFMMLAFSHKVCCSLQPEA